MGILPNLIFRPTDAAVSQMIEQAEARLVMQAQETGE